MYYNRIFALVAVFLVLVDFVWFFIRGKKNGFISSSDRADKKYLIKIIGIYVLSAGIITLAFFREFGTIGDLVFCGCGELRIDLANRQLLGIDEE